MAWTIGGLELPQNPTRVTMQYKAVTKVLKYPLNKEIIMSMGRAADKLLIEGVIHVAGQTQTQLDTTYLTPYRNMVRTEVTIDSGASAPIYDDDWVMMSFYFEEVGGYTNHYRYKMEFVLGGLHYVLT